MTNDKKLQMKYIITLLLMVFVSTVIIGGGIYYSILSEVQYRLPDAADNAITSAAIFSGVNNLLVWLVPSLFVAVVAVNILLLNRLTGPIYRCISHLESMSRGDLTFEAGSIGGEELNELVKAVRSAKENLAVMVSDEKSAANKVLAASDKLLKECDKGKPDAEKITALAVKLRENLEELQITQSKFRINK